MPSETKPTARQTPRAVPKSMAATSKTVTKTVETANTDSIVRKPKIAAQADEAVSESLKTVAHKANPKTTADAKKTPKAASITQIAEDAITVKATSSPATVTIAPIRKPAAKRGTAKVEIKLGAKPDNGESGVATAGKSSAQKTAATRHVAAAFVAARQKMAAPAQDVKSIVSTGGGESGKGAVQVADKKLGKTVVENVTAIAPAAPSQPVVSVAPRPFTPADRGLIRVARPAPVKGQGFKTGEFIVYPAHGVGQITAVEEQEVAGYKLELFVISFVKDKMILKVPLPKISSVGMRKLAEAPVVKRSLDTLTGRARVKRTMWSRRAQEYEAKINSGDLVAIAEVVRDLYRSDAQPEQSYSERQLYEAALDRMAREIAVVQKLTDMEALKLIDDQLQKGPRRTKAEDVDLDESDTEAATEGGIGEAA